MRAIYIAIKDGDKDSMCPTPRLQILLDEHDLINYIKSGWECYILTGLKKVESVQTTVIECDE